MAINNYDLSRSGEAGRCLRTDDQLFYELNAGLLPDFSACLPESAGDAGGAPRNSRALRRVYTNLFPVSNHVERASKDSPRAGGTRNKCGRET
jgi:hypothetical protein